MSEDGKIELRFNWSQASGDYGASDVHVRFYEDNSNREVALIVVPNTEERTIDLIHSYRKPETTISLPASFLDSVTTHDDRLDMLRTSLFKAAEDT